MSKDGKPPKIEYYVTQKPKKAEKPDNFYNIYSRSSHSVKNYTDYSFGKSTQTDEARKLFSRLSYVEIYLEILQRLSEEGKYTIRTVCDTIYISVGTVFLEITPKIEEIEVALITNSQSSEAIRSRFCFVELSEIGDDFWRELITAYKQSHKEE